MLDQTLRLRIAIDGNEANVKNRVGSNVYAQQILLGLERLTYKYPRVEVTVLLADSKLPDLPRRRRHWNYQVIGPQKMWTQWSLPLFLRRHQTDFDVFFTPGHYAPRLSSVPYICTVMDLAFLKFPEQFKTKDRWQLERWTKYSVQQAAKVVAISEFTKQEVVTNYGRQPQDVVVAHPGVTEHSQVTVGQVKQVTQKLNLPANYLLHLGTIQPRKNLLGVVQAFEKLSFHIDKENFHQQKILKRRGRRSKLSFLTDLQLLVAGKVGWLADETLAYIKRSPVKDKIRLLGFVDEELKPVLIAQSQAVVMAGFYEGFGIPALEAMQYGSIPIVAKNSSLVEVVGHAGVLVDPDDVDSITLGFKEVLSLSAKQRAILRKHARQQSKQFNWDSSARTILQTLAKVVNEKKHFPRHPRH